MLDRDLAELYGVKPIALRQQVRRNMERFPDDFMFQLSDEEITDLLSQNVIPSRRSLGGSLRDGEHFADGAVAMFHDTSRYRKETGSDNHPQSCLAKSRNYEQELRLLSEHGQSDS